MTTLRTILFVDLKTIPLQKDGFVDTRVEMEGAASPEYSPQRGSTNPKTIEDYGGIAETYTWR